MHKQSRRRLVVFAVLGACLSALLLMEACSGGTVLGALCALKLPMLASVHLPWRRRSKNVKVPMVFDVCRTAPDYAQTLERLAAGQPAVSDEALAPLEDRRWKEVQALLAKTQTSVRGFYHVSTWKPYWRDVVREQLAILDQRLLQVVPVLVNVVGVGSAKEGDLAQVQAVVAALPLRSRGMLAWGSNETVPRYAFKKQPPEAREAMARNTQLSEGEYPTLMLLHAHCRREVAQGRRAVVFYVHNKGGCCVRDAASRADRPSLRAVDKTNAQVCAWREAMNAMILTYPSVCARALSEARYAACGFEFLLDYHTPHYSGNFFWARCEYVAALPPMPDRFDSYGAELWLFNRSGHAGDANRLFGRRCGYSTFNCCMDLYKQECTRDRWSWKVGDMLESDVIIPSNADLTRGVPGPSLPNPNPNPNPSPNLTRGVLGPSLPLEGECYR